MCPRGRGLVENEEQDENKKMKSIAVEEQEQEEGSEGESETEFVDLDQDTLFNVLKRVDVATLGRAACVNKLWKEVARDDRIWEPIVIRSWAGCGCLEYIDILRIDIRSNSCYRIFSALRFYLAELSPSDFYSIDPQVFSRRIGPWR